MKTKACKASAVSVHPDSQTGMPYVPDASCNVSPADGAGCLANVLENLYGTVKSAKALLKNISGFQLRLQRKLFLFEK